jgi:hypothetical protein
MHRVGASVNASLAVAGAAGVLVAGVPLGVVALMLYRGAIASIELPRRTTRFGPLLAAVGGLLVLLLGLAAMRPAGAAWTGLVVACYAANVGLAMLITYWWKISVHCLSLASFAAMAGGVHVLAPQPGGPGIDTAMQIGIGGALALLPVLIWARVRIGAHTPAQAVTGALLGLVVPAAEIALLARLLNL